jgi:RNA 3'-terminal phosphate cyclase (ATP)
MMDWPEECVVIRQLSEDEGPGNVVMIEAGSEEVTEVFTACGRRGLRAESVAESVLRQAKAYLAAGVPVGTHLAEHLLVPMALAAGESFVTAPLSRCAAGTVELIRLFLGAAVSVEPQGKERYLVTVPAGRSISRVASAPGDGHHVGE